MAENLRRERTAVQAKAMPKTAPSKERASWERREARACSGEDIWRFVKGSHIRLCVCERERGFGE